MMTFAFDLISDLHVETWGAFDWTDQATSPYCLVAGDISEDRQIVYETLKHLGEQYLAVFYIDGNAEHAHYVDDLGNSYKELDTQLANLKNVVFMQDNIVIVNSTAIVATNGWWTYDFDPKLDYDQSINWFKEKENLTLSQVTGITGVAYHDAAYLINTVDKLQTHPDVDSIIVLSHTVPAPWIIEHDIDLLDTWRFNMMGNSSIHQTLYGDSENKIKAWCFGHYHKNVDRELNGIRYVSNCRGRGNTPWSQSTYYPKRIEI